MKIKVCKTCHCPIPMPWYGCAVCRACKERIGPIRWTEKEKEHKLRAKLREGAAQGTLPDPWQRYVGAYLTALDKLGAVQEATP